MKSVVLADDGEPVIKTAQGYQHNGLYFGSLKDLDRGEYRLISGPPISFDDYWNWAGDEKLSWPAMIHRMVNERGARYQPVSE
jgi:hypothetical protein